ncbi:MAG: hypothetical protein L0Z70_08270 [Chloroflexi bacterium]|nr:hypothetical protein [Chloroflexota bacterium]
MYAIFNALGVFMGGQKDYREVTFRVDGSASAAVVTYTQENGEATKPLDVTLPWKKTVRFKEPRPVYLTVGNPSQIGEIRCVILLDGEAWKEQRAAAPLDKVACAGIVP